MRSKEALIALAMMLVLLALLAMHASAVPSVSARAIADSNPAESPWPMFRHDVQHTGRSPYVGPAWPQLRWRYPTSSCAVVESSPAIGADGTIYIGSFDGYLYAIRPEGYLQWRYKTGLKVYSSPAIAADGTIYVGSYDGYLYAIHPDGSLQWRYEKGSGRASSPAIAANGIIYIGSGNGPKEGYLHAIYPDGSLRWRYETEGGVESSPAIGGDGTVYIAAAKLQPGTVLYAIHPDGSLRWRYETGDWVESSPAIGGDGTIYVGSDDGYLYAIHPDGSLRWRYETDGGVRSSPAIGGDGTVYVGSNDGHLYAIHPDGSLRWRYGTEGGVESSPAIGGDGTIYVGSDDGYLYAIHPDGSLRWRYETGDWVRSSPAIAKNGTIYVGSDDTFLYAIEEGPTPTATPTGPTPTPTPTVTPPLRVNVMPHRDAWVGEPLVIWGNAVGGSAMSESSRASWALAGSRVPDRAVTSEPPSGWTSAKMDIGATTPYLRLRVNQTHDWVDACTSPGATVWITVTDSLGNIKGMANGNGGSDGCISANEFDWDGDRPDFVVGDRVDGYSSDGSTAVATVVNIIAQVDAEANTLTGQVFGVPYPATVRGEVWVEGGPGLDAQTDMEGHFFFDFNPFDIQPGTDVAVWYIQPDGNWVGIVCIATPYLHLRVNQTHDWVNACTSTGATVWITVTSALGDIKGTATGVARPNCWVWDFDWDGNAPDIVVGDRVDGYSSDGSTAVATVVNIIAQVDAEANTLTGQVLGVPYPATVRGEVWVEGGPGLEAQTDMEGRFFFDFNPFDIQPGTDVAVWYIQPDGNWVGIVCIATPYLHLRVNQTHDWVDASTSFGATVEITVTDAFDNVKGTARGVALRDRGSIWAGDFDWDGDRPDFVVGDRVDGYSSDGSTAVATVVNIIAQVDAEANTLTGQVLGVPYPATVRGEVWVEGGPGLDAQTDMEGRFFFDFNPFDIQPGTNVAAWYIQPNGNWVGVVGSELVYTWTFGDRTDAAIGNVTDARYINTTHTYYAAGTYTATLTVKGGGYTDSDQVAITVHDRSAVTDTLPIDVNIAIERGLRWLYLNQDEETGAWTPWDCSVATASEVVLAFEVHDHLPENDPDSDIYAETVQRGLDYLLAGARAVGIEPQPAGDPDVNGNGFGVAVCGRGEMYEPGMFMCALVGSRAPNRVVASGPLSGWTYAEVMQDCVDFIAYAQTDAGEQRGGWRYSPNSCDGDNSVSQWPVLGLLGAKVWEEYVTVPAFVADELEHWVEFIQSEDGGSGYGGPGVSNVARTGALLVEMGYLGDNAGTPRVQRAIQFLGSHWHDKPGEPPEPGSGGNKGNLYAMYGVKRGLHVLNVDRVPVAGYPEGLDWYRDYATWLTGEQTPEGNWEYNDLGDNHDDYLTTAWALLILKPTIFGPPPTPTPTPVVVTYRCSPGDSIYRIDASSFSGYRTKSASDSSLIRVTSPPAPLGWNQPDFVPDSSWQPGSAVWWDAWAAPIWCPLPAGCSPVGLLDKHGKREAWDGTTHLYRCTFTLSPPEAGMQVTRAVLEMWSDNKTEWWWQGTSISYDRQGYVGQVDLFPAHVWPNGGTYVLAIQNSNDYVCPYNCNPQGTACRLSVTWAFPTAPGYRVYLPLILKRHP